MLIWAFVQVLTLTCHGSTFCQVPTATAKITPSWRHTWQAKATLWQLLTSFILQNLTTPCAFHVRANLQDVCLVELITCCWLKQALSLVWGHVFIHLQCFAHLHFTSATYQLCTISSCAAFMLTANTANNTYETTSIQPNHQGQIHPNNHV